MERADAPAALHQGHDRALIGGAVVALLGDGRTPCGARARLLDRAVVGLIGFHNFAFATERRKVQIAATHRLADAVENEPSGVVLATKRAVELVGGKALLA